MFLVINIGKHKRWYSVEPGLLDPGRSISAFCLLARAAGEPSIPDSVPHGLQNNFAHFSMPKIGRAHV